MIRLEKYRNLAMSIINLALLLHLKHKLGEMAMNFAVPLNQITLHRLRNISAISSGRIPIRAHREQPQQILPLRPALCSYLDDIFD